MFPMWQPCLPKIGPGDPGLGIPTHKDNQLPESSNVCKFPLFCIPWGCSQTKLTRFWLFLTTYLSVVKFFTVWTLTKSGPFLDHLPASSCKCSLCTTPHVKASFKVTEIVSRKALIKCYLLHGNMEHEADTETIKTIYCISKGFVILAQCSSTEITL